MNNNFDWIFLFPSWFVFPERNRMCWCYDRCLCWIIYILSVKNCTVYKRQTPRPWQNPVGLDFGELLGPWPTVRTSPNDDRCGFRAPSSTTLLPDAFFCRSDHLQSVVSLICKALTCKKPPSHPGRLLHRLRFAIYKSHGVSKSYEGAVCTEELNSRWPASPTAHFCCSRSARPALILNFWRPTTRDSHDSVTRHRIRSNGRWVITTERSRPNGELFFYMKMLDCDFIVFKQWCSSHPFGAVHQSIIYWFLNE
jgi:hypothetical protein